MYTIRSLNALSFAELEKIAKKLNIDHPEGGAEQLIYKILDAQASTPAAKSASSRKESSKQTGSEGGRSRSKSVQKEAVESGRHFVKRHPESRTQTGAAQVGQAKPAAKRGGEKSEKSDKPLPTHAKTNKHNAGQAGPRGVVKLLPQERQRRQMRSSGKYNNHRTTMRQANPLAGLEGVIEGEGVLEWVAAGKNYAFLRSSSYNYLSSPDDIHVSYDHIKKWGLKRGDTVRCTLRPPQVRDKYFGVVDILSVNGEAPERIKERIDFEHLTPVFPDQKINIVLSSTDLGTRVADMATPIGYGQRGLVVAPPKAGKTDLLKKLAQAIAQNHPLNGGSGSDHHTPAASQPVAASKAGSASASQPVAASKTPAAARAASAPADEQQVNEGTYLMVVLIDERPEEGTDMARHIDGEVVVSTFDRKAEDHVKLAELALEKAKRLVEMGRDVVIILDSITRLARAYNTITRSSGKTLSGGVDAHAMEGPKRFFGAARNIEGGGSLTILATALVETGSKADQLIFEEFKGTGNMELHLDRTTANRGIFPAINLMLSSTRRNDLLQSPKTCSQLKLLRRAIADRKPHEAIQFLLNHMQGTKNNAEFLASMHD